MFHLLIVDDEENVVNGLANDIDWASVQIERVYKAGNVNKALEHLNRDRIDVVITDIRMPEKDGLELGLIVKRQWPFAKIIILSGYDEFEYAQSAINLGVIRYLTKPISYEEIKQAVAKAVREIEEDIDRAARIENSERRLVEMLPILQNAFLNDLVTKRGFVEKDLNRKLASYRIALKDGLPAQIVLVKVDDWDNTGQLDQEERIMASIQQVFMELFVREEAVCCFVDADGNAVFLVQNESEAELIKSIAYLKGMAETFQLTIRNRWRISVSIYVGRRVKAIKELSAAYEDIQQQLRRDRWRSAGLIVLSPERERSATDYPTEALFAFPSLSALIESLQQDEAVRRIDEIFAELEQNPSPPKEVVMQIYFTVSDTLIRLSNRSGYALEEWMGEEIDSLYAFDRLRSLGSLKLWCLSGIDKYIRYVLFKERDHKRHLIARAKQMIQNNLMEETSLVHIAAHLYLHPNYLSRLFKEAEGVSISEYITQIRMEKAKELLGKPELKIYEIAVQVGYESVASFSRLFKREVGVSPKEYRK